MTSSQPKDGCLCSARESVPNIMEMELENGEGMSTMAGMSTSIKAEEMMAIGSNIKEDIDMEGELKEQEHFQLVILTFKQYRAHQTKLLSETLLKLQRLNPKLTSARERLTRHLECINKNALFFFRMVEGAPFATSSQLGVGVTKGLDFVKVESTLRQFVRDWSVNGAQERERVYRPILDRLVRLNAGGKVLVPGAGLGRLCYEIANLGYACEGNEFSYFMLLGSNFALNQSNLKFEIYPWIHSKSNLLSAEQQLENVIVPDITVGTVPKDFSMCAGDFTKIYITPDQKDKWDVIVTCYFIDTAKNFVDYLTVITHCLKPHGHWINLGPLLYHFEGEPDSFEYTLEEIQEMISADFTIIEQEFVKSTYSENPASLLQHVYNSWIFTAQKK